MNIEIVNKIDEMLELINNDKDFIKMKKLEKELENSKELMNDIKTLKEIEDYSDEYISLKKKILDNKDFSEYKFLERDLNLLVYEINTRLNSLKEKSGCR